MAMAILCKVVWPAEDVFRGFVDFAPANSLGVSWVFTLCGAYDALADKAEAGVLCHGWRPPSSSASSPILAAPRRPALFLRLKQVVHGTTQHCSFEAHKVARVGHGQRPAFVSCHPAL
jgi:hypothetical protein